MYELSRSEYGRVAPLFEKLRVDRLAVLLVFQGDHPGRVFVNDRERPRVALISAGSCYLGGDAGIASLSALKDLINAEILPGAEGGPLFLFSTTEEWKDVLDELLKDHGARRIKRLKFELDMERFQAHRGWPECVPDAYDVRRVDGELVSHMPGYAFEYWGDADAFLAGGFGYAVVKEGELVSVCWTMLLGGGIAELAVETVESHMRQGFATLAGCACIERCLERGLRPEWDCFELPASMNLARKLGFTKTLEVDLHFVAL